MGGGTRNILKGETSFMVYFASLVLGGNRFGCFAAGTREIVASAQKNDRPLRTLPHRGELGRCNLYYFTQVEVTAILDNWDASLLGGKI